MDGIGEISTLSNAFKHPFPVADAIRTSKIESAVWMSALEMLESRLFLANAIHNNDWWEQPENRGHQVDPKLTPLTINDIRQMSLILDGYLVKKTSKEEKTKLPFNLKKTISNILNFKMSISVDPAFRMVFHAAIQGIYSETPFPHPRLIVIPTDGPRARLWYRYYGFYSGIMKLVAFNGEALSKLSFKNSWLDEEDGILIMLICYALHSGRDERTLLNLYQRAEKTAQTLPSARLLLSSIKALHLRIKPSL